MDVKSDKIHNLDIGIRQIHKKQYTTNWPVCSFRQCLSR